ncbi:MAG: hypothetical protein GEU81_17100 [Nitriliruptorales bacterium]|nr:hypothetical protein [Nitriliruptorales bacterium]
MTGANTGAKPRPGDLVITVVMLGMFVVGYVAAEAWPYRAALFPRLLSSAAIVLAILKLVDLGLQWRRASPRPAADQRAGDAELAGEEEEQDQSLEYVFATAGGRAWSAALAWVAGFFVGLWLLGVFVMVPLFAFLYLLVVGKARWYSATIYALVCFAVLHVAFRELLAVPMPSGIF